MYEIVVRYGAREEYRVPRAGKAAAEAAYKEMSRGAGVKYAALLRDGKILTWLMK